MFDKSGQNQLHLDKLGDAVPFGSTDQDATLVTVHVVDGADLGPGTIYSDIISTDVETITTSVSGTSDAFGLNPAGSFSDDDGQRIFRSFFFATEF